MKHPTITQALLSALEQIINLTLRYDPASRQRIAAIDSTLAVEVRPYGCLYLQGQAKGIRLQQHYEEQCTKVSGTSAAFLQLLQNPEALASLSIDVAGNTATLHQWQKALQHIDIDWEDAISQAFGDVIGPAIARGLQSTAKQSHHFLQEQQRLLKEYLTEEGKLTPHPIALSQWSEQIQHLQMATDRLEVRLQALSLAISKQKASS